MVFLYLLLNVFCAGPVNFHGLATSFHFSHKDRNNPDDSLACLVKARNKLTKKAKELLKQELFVASKELPCWTIIEICLPRTDKCSLAVVADFGPAKAALDLWDTLKKKLGHNGKEEVEWMLY